MARPRSIDEARVLESAMALFQELGYEGASVPQLTKRLGICRQSLYTNFGDKRALYLKALDHWGRQEIDPKVAMLEEDGSPLDNVRTVVRGLAAYATDCPNAGCMTVTAMVEGREDAEALAVVERQVERLEGSFRAALEQAQKLGELDSRARPQQLARTIVTSIYGIGLLTRLPGSGPRIADAVAVLLGVIDDAAVPASGQ